jgi:hypothetical protein
VSYRGYTALIGQTFSTASVPTEGTKSELGTSHLDPKLRPEPSVLRRLAGTEEIPGARDEAWRKQGPELRVVDLELQVITGPLPDNHTTSCS